MAVRLPKLCRNPISAHTYPCQGRGGASYAESDVAMDGSPRVKIRQCWRRFGGTHWRQHCRADSTLHYVSINSLSCQYHNLIAPGSLKHPRWSGFVTHPSGRLVGNAVPIEAYPHSIWGTPGGSASSAPVWSWGSGGLGKAGTPAGSGPSSRRPVRSAVHKFPRFTQSQISRLANGLNQLNPIRARCAR